mmetsp:Transcript_40009/g.127950  ORF Transcript_40009/g.127950 Transcript_40009/m.127950 type:complete len:120 (-) Transcript_40009:1153-1512(-)
MPDLTKDELYAALVEKLAGEGSGRGGRQDGGGGARTRSRWPSACWSWERSRTGRASCFQAWASSCHAVLAHKQYYKLSALVHPDKLERTFKQATIAFQLLVTAYERLSQMQPPPQLPKS